MKKDIKIAKIKKPHKHEYRMKTSVKYEGVIYKKGEAVKLNKELLKIFINNNYIYG